MGAEVPRFRDWPVGRWDVVSGAGVVVWFGLAVALRAWGLP
jgi:hypothetical protein